MNRAWKLLMFGLSKHFIATPHSCFTCNRRPTLLDRFHKKQCIYFRILTASHLHLSLIHSPVCISCNLQGKEVGKDKGGARCEASTYFTAWDVTEKYQSKIHWLLEQLEISVACNAGDKCFFSHIVVIKLHSLARQISWPHSWNTFQVSGYQIWTVTADRRSTPINQDSWNLVKSILLLDKPYWYHLGNFMKCKKRNTLCGDHDQPINPFVHTSTQYQQLSQSTTSFEIQF
jgi:hypothetical protein